MYRLLLVLTQRDVLYQNRFSTLAPKLIRNNTQLLYETSGLNSHQRYSIPKGVATALPRNPNYVVDADNGTWKTAIHHRPIMAHGWPDLATLQN